MREGGREVMREVGREREGREMRGRQRGNMGRENPFLK